MTARPREREARATPGTHAALLLAGVLFGGLPVAAKVTMTEIPPALLCFIRAALAAILLHAAARFSGRGRVPGGFPVYVRLALLSLIGVVFNQLLFLYGLQRTTATAAVILITSIPVFTATFAGLLGVEVLTGRRAAGIAVALAGVLVMLDSGFGAVAAGAYLVGNLMVLANASSWSLFLVVSRSTRERMDAVTMMAWIFTFGAIVVSPLGLRDAARMDFGAVSLQAWTGLAYVVFFATSVTYWLTLWALRSAGPTVAALYTYVQPVVTALLAAAILSERVTAREVAAAVLVGAGVWLASSHAPAPAAGRGR